MGGSLVRDPLVKTAPQIVINPPADLGLSLTLLEASRISCSSDEGSVLLHYICNNSWTVFSSVEISWKTNRKETENSIEQLRELRPAPACE